MRIAILPTLLPLTLAACQMAAPQPAAEADACNASGWTWMIGEPVDLVSSTTFPAPMRVVGPLGPITTDYLPNRLNVVYNDRGIITGVECG